MSKIICDICGTSYQDTADCCPICGCSRDTAASLLGEEVVTEEIVEETKPKGGRFAPKKKEIFDFDEVNADPEDDEDEEDEDDDYDEEEDEDEAPRHNTLVVILLTVLIAGLLLAAGFIFFRYFLPNMGEEETAPNTTAVQVQQTTEASTEVTIPCEVLAIDNATKAVLSPGGNFLINAIPTPANTTDKLIYVSADESIATVSEDGKITAVSEGTTKIFISCGKSTVECDVEVKIEEETVPPTTEAVVVETGAVEETAPAAVPTEDAEDPGLKSDVVLKLKKTDIMLGVYYKFTLQLDCDLEQNEVEWTSEHPHIATVDENGVVTAVKSGTTIVTARYGDQEVQCWVRCG